MKKKIVLFLVAFLFIFIPSVDASTVTCTYMPDDGSDGTVVSYTFDFSVTNDTSTLSKITKKVNNETSQITDMTLAQFGFSLYPKTTSECPREIEAPEGSAMLTTRFVEERSSWLTSSKVSCGTINNIPAKIPDITATIVNILQFAVPVILVIMGGIDLVKGVMSGKEDEIKKGQQSLIKRLLVGVIIFFIIAFAKLLVGIAATNATESNNIIKCIDCFTKGSSSCK